MKVLMLGWELPPFHVGGMGVVCYQLCKALSKQDVDIEFILPYTADHEIDFMKVNPALPYSASYIQGTGGIYDSANTGFMSYGAYPNQDDQQSLYTDAVLKLAEANEYDVIHAHDWLTFRAAIAAKMRTGVPLIVHVHATEFDRSGRNTGNSFVREIEYYGLRLADKIIAVSQATKDTIIQEYDIDPAKIEVVHNNIDVEPQYIDEHHNTYKYLEYMKTKGYKVVINAGRLTIQKGLDGLLEAAQEVIARDSKVLFVIAGGGELFNELLLKAADLGISNNVILTGYINGTGKSWRDIFRVADLFVMPSVSEPFGVAALEAVAYGTPVLVSKQSGVSEAINNVLKVDFWDIKEMANMIFSTVQNPVLKDELHNNAYKELMATNWSNQARSVMNVYDSQRVGAVA